MANLKTLDFCVDLPPAIATVEIDVDHFLGWMNTEHELNYTAEDIPDMISPHTLVRYLLARNMTRGIRVTPSDFTWVDQMDMFDLQYTTE